VVEPRQPHAGMSIARRRHQLGMATEVLVMKVLLTFSLAAVFAVATTGAFGQATSNGSSGATKPMPSASDGGTTQYAPGRVTGDTSKMGIAGPESPVDSDAPNVASCKTITAADKREKCLAQARQAGKAHDAASGVPAAARKGP